MIPEKFCERMRAMLKDSYEEFEKALSEPSVRAIRVNEAKISVDDFLECTKLSLAHIPYAHDGFIPDCTDGIGNTPEHHAGMFYVQDPGAMATVNAIDIKPDWWVLDSCAAPGGKASQIASRLTDGGFLLANEYVPKRAKIIVSNFERMGLSSALVTSLDTARLSEMFHACFDLVLCDAPCSGEGMFRKYDEALTEWSEENVLACARRQREILENLAKAVRPGGYLLYSTCTYSLEENEDTVEYFLDRHPEFSVCECTQKVRSATVDGIVREGSSREEMRLTRRFYPHISKGEGQYIALLKKDENPEDLPTILYKDAAKLPTKEEISITRAFIKSTFQSFPDTRLIKQGDFIVSVPHDCPIPQHSVFMPGVVLGEVKRGVFFPHHQLFSVYGKLMKQQENLSHSDDRTAKYLRGEEIEARECSSGYCCVCYEGVPLGGGKTSGGKIKNHYPKGRRNF